MELAYAWGCAPTFFFDQPDEIIATAADILEEVNSRG